MSATVNITLKADSSLTKKSLPDEIWVGWDDEDCTDEISATSPFTPSTSVAVASAKTSGSSSCDFNDSEVKFYFYNDSAKTVEIGYVKFHEDCGTDVWTKDGISPTFYPSPGSYGYAVAYVATAGDNNYTVTIEAVDPSS